MEHPNTLQTYVSRLRIWLASSLIWAAQWLRSSFLAPYLPWLFPFVVQFVIAHGGLRVEIRRNGRLIPQWRMRMLRSQFPLPLVSWIEHVPQYLAIQPYPWVRQLYDDLQTCDTENFIVHGTTFACLLQIAQPEDFALIWTIDARSESVVGRYTGIEHDLGMGWFQRDNHIWSLRGEPNGEIVVLLRDLTMPLDKAVAFVSSVIPRMNTYLPVRTDFVIIEDFALMLVASHISFGTMTLGLQCNYPDLLPSLQTQHSYEHLIIAHHALICFPRAAITPRIAQLLQSRTTMRLTSTEIPCFLRDELPSLQVHGVISDMTIVDMRTRNPIVAIPTLQPTRILSHQQEQGIGTYQARTTYQYDTHTVDGAALIRAGRQGDRFIRQHDAWFEWPQNSLLQAIASFQKDGEPITLTSAEVMGLDMTRLSAWHLSPPSLAIIPVGISSADRGRDLFEHFRRHGVPGGIVGQPKGIYSVLADVGESLLSSHPQAQILWVVPANKKGSVTRTLRDKPLMNRCASVVTPAIIATVPQIMTKRWTLIIFQELDQLLAAAEQYNLLPRLQWCWAITTLTPNAASRSNLMRVLHLPEHGYDLFCNHYLYDIEKESNRPIHFAAQTLPRIMPIVTAYPAPHPINATSSAIPAKPTSDLPNKPSIVSPAKPMPVLASEALPPPRAAPQRDPQIILDPHLIAMLLRESAELQERLTIEDVDIVITAVRRSIRASLVPVAPTVTSDAALITRQSMPDVGDDWQSIAEQWQPIHWQIIAAIHMAEPSHLALIAQQAHRPLSLFIDEINAVVDKQINDNLIDPNTHVMTEYYQETAGHLVQWHLQRK